MLSNTFSMVFSFAGYIPGRSPHGDLPGMAMSCECGDGIHGRDAFGGVDNLSGNVTICRGNMAPMSKDLRQRPPV